MPPVITTTIHDGVVVLPLYGVILLSRHVHRLSDSTKPSVVTDSSQAFTTQALRTESPCRDQSGDARRISAFKAVTLPRAPQGGHHRQQPPGHGHNRPLGTTTLLEVFVDASPPDTTPQGSPGRLH